VLVNGRGKLHLVHPGYQQRKIIDSFNGGLLHGASPLIIWILVGILCDGRGFGKNRKPIQTRAKGEIQISIVEAYQLTAREKAWLAKRSQTPVTQRAYLNGGNALWWSIRYESGDIASPDYLSLLIRVDVQTGEFRRCIFLKGEEGEERSEQCPEVDEDTTE
jgi:hypothetical protein